jgi:hypothetical protein
MLMKLTPERRSEWYSWIFSGANVVIEWLMFHKTMPRSLGEKAIRSDPNVEKKRPSK